MEQGCGLARAMAGEGCGTSRDYPVEELTSPSSVARITGPLHQLSHPDHEAGAGPDPQGCRKSCRELMP